MNRQIPRIVVIGVCSFGIGLVVNTLNPRGIHFRELLMLLPCGSFADFRSVSADSAIYMMYEEEAHFVDMRPADQFDIDRIPHAMSLPFRQYVRTPSAIRSRMDGRPVILYDFHPNRKEAAFMGKLMQKEGVTEILLLKEGFAGWIARDMPIERSVRDF